MSIVAHQYGKFQIQQSSQDEIIAGHYIPKGYVNATAMCKANGKQLKRYNESSSAKAYREAFLKSVAFSDLPPTIEIDSGSNAFRGTWMHPTMTFDLARWISAEFAVWCDEVLRHVIDNDYLALTKEAAIAEAKLKEVWDKVRQSSIDTRNNYTDAIDRYVLRHPERSDKYRAFIYVNCSDALNRSLFGKAAKQLCEERLCDRDRLRDTHSETDLKRIDHIEAHAIKLMDKRDVEPLEAIEEALEFYS
jgi:hypothetical protein